jgi:hypothetical protein
MIPPYVFSVRQNVYLKFGWRFFMQAIFMLPFAMHEKRIGTAEVKEQFKLKHIFNLTHLKQIYFSSFVSSFWFFAIFFAFRFTQIGNGLVLATLQNFIMSLNRASKNFQDNHSIEFAGQLMCTLGIILILLDSLTFDQNDINPSALTYRVTGYIYCSKLKRFFFGDLIALAACIIVVKL